MKAEYNINRILAKNHISKQNNSFGDYRKIYFSLPQNMDVVCGSTESILGGTGEPRYLLGCGPGLTRVASEGHIPCVG